MVQPPRVNSDNGLPQRWLTTVTSSYDKNLHPQISQRVGFSPQITGYFQYFMHNIATIYQHQLNKFESLTLVSMRAVYPENFHPIGSVPKKWQTFFSFHEENFGVDLATKKQHLCTIYPAHFLSDFRKSTLLCYSIKVFWVKPSGEPQVANMWLKIEFNIATFYQHIREKKMFQNSLP